MCTKSIKRAVMVFRILSIPTLVIVTLLLMSGPALAQDPDFSTIDDPLDGEYELFTVDDLLIHRTKPISGGTRSQVNNYVLETANEAVSSNQSRSTVTTAPCLLPGGEQPQKAQVGRFFALPYDVIITLAPTPAAQSSDCSTTDGSDNMAIYIQDIHTTDTVSVSLSMSAIHTSVAMDDFTGDGFEDLVVMNQSEIFVATATVITDTDQGLVLGPKTQITPAQSSYYVYDPTTGDFNGDGFVDIAWIGQNNRVRFATVCPDSVENTVCAGADKLTVILDPLGAGSADIALNADAGDCAFFISVVPIAITAGQFTSTPIDHMITVDLVQTGTQNNLPTCAYKVHWYEFNGTFSPTEIEAVTLIDQPANVNTGIAVSNFYARSARLGWFDDAEQAVIALGSNDGSNFIYHTHVYVVSFDTNKMTIAETQTTGPGSNANQNQPFAWVNGMAIGRYVSVPDDPDSETDFNQQIAVLTNNGAVEIYGVSNPPTDVTPALLTQTNLDASLELNNRPENAPGDQSTYYSWLVAGDLQGRSARLGPPSVIRLTSHSQPSVILGAPPMHIDYILPDEHTASDWDIVNFTAIPSSYNSQYSMSRTESNQSSNTNKTSYTYATTEKGAAGISIKPPYVPNISGSIKTTTTDKSEDVSETYAFAKNEFTYDASTTTGFGDEIWFDQSAFNLYLYPVLGETVCPADNASCSADEEQPLYLMFSGPNSSGVGPAPGATTEWYQPVHEPGNLFSYPWNETQLISQIDSMSLLSAPQHFYTDDSSQTQNLSWSAGSGNSVTAGSTNSHSHDKSYSLTAGKDIGKIINVNLEGDVDYNDSSATSNLNQSTSSIGASQGIAIEKPGDFLDYVLYQYRVEPYLFGRSPSPENVDTTTLTETVQTYGPLQAGFVANPTDSLSGSWWSDSNNPYRQDIDVALNHPVRWSRTSEELAVNCLGSGSYSYCVDFNDPDASDLWNSEFYWMRGLFVTIGGLAGPQRAQATEGDDVYLEARVYNYSLKDMDAASTIKVQFYRQEMIGTNPTGDSVLIGEVDVDPLPGFNSDTNPSAPNWTTASTSFDTTGLGDKTYIFWVVVWVEDSSGNMVTELSGHGLSAKPGTLTSIGDVQLAEVTLEDESRTFSNNVGYLHKPFYIAPASQDPESLTPATELQVANAQASSTTPEVFERIIISANVQAEAGTVDGVVVDFYAGDPDAGGRAFDTEMIPHIRSGASVPVAVPYRSSSCGEQQIVVVARTAELIATKQSVTMNVPCPPIYLPVVTQAAVE